MGKVFIETYGCQMNEYDTDKMFELLGTQNYTPASSMDEADLVLLNTCSV
ncbi:MAG: tRNA (N6-isopentenyl adenosine(37)-C2)-methylthiotransferase MiaB, partial [SAR324 cluster bacterium]|nr:tRNA (N6-isopentenyl adenosine(37)-C2)-methylthiotransferase MiaB [SAR324 cluster bacterium]